MEEKMNAAVKDISFKDLVAAQVARFIELKQNKLEGNENVIYILDEIRSTLEDGNWTNWLEIDERNDIQS
jgi:hypothetical protein